MPRKAPGLDGLGHSPTGPGDIWDQLHPQAPFPQQQPPTASDCSALSPLSPRPALISPFVPFLCYPPLRSPFPSVPRPLGASPSPHPRSTPPPAHGPRLAHALRADTKAPGQRLQTLASKLDL